MQPTICLGYAHLRAGLGEFLALGGRRVGEWQSGLHRLAVPFDDPQAFGNINTPEELSASNVALRTGKD
jgi:molybdopterin-guanine dinucleotide biosynthesis protein A